jgi:LysM repeat protein
MATRTRASLNTGPKGPTVGFIPVVKSDKIRPVYALLGFGAAVASSGGGWVSVSRPKRVGFTVWNGQDPYQMNIQILFDGLQNDSSVEGDYEALRRIMRVPVGAAGAPSPCLLAGAVPLTQVRWVLQAIDQDASSIIRRQDGQLVRVAVTVSLLEYVEADVAVALKPSPAKAAVSRKPKQAPSVRSYTVVSGDTLSRIAQKLLGSYSRYPEIAELNGLRDPNRIFPGQVLKLP